MDQDYSMSLVWDKLSRSSRERLLEWVQYHHNPKVHMGILALLSTSTVLDVLARVERLNPYINKPSLDEVESWRNFIVEAIHIQQQRERTETMNELMYNRRVRYNDRTGS